MHTLKSIERLLSESKQTAESTKVEPKVQRKARRDFIKYTAIKKVVIEGFSGEYLQSEFERLTKKIVSINSAIIKASTNKKTGEIIKEIKSRLVKEYDLPLLRSQKNNIDFILTG